jgi:tetratricopeptide (TPR) repeat protein
VPVLRGDVETIVTKALEKEPERRYVRAADLASDIRRFLADQPISARPVSRTYQLAKFARRHRVLVASVAVLIVVLAAGVVGTTSQMVRAERERDRVSEAKALADERFEEAEELRRQESESRRRTENALRRAEAVARLQRDMFASAAPGKQGRNVKVADVLDGASREIGQSLAADPDLEMAMRASLGETYRGLGLLEESERELARVVEIARALHGENQVETLRAQVALADVIEDRSRFDEARRLYDEALAGFVARGGEEDPGALTVLNNRASLRNKQGEGDAAEADLRRVLAVRERTNGADSIETASAMSGLGQLLHERGKAAEAEDMIRRALDISRASIGDRAPDTLTRMSILATYLRQRGALEDSEKLYREILATRREVQGERHYDTFTAMNNLAGLLQERGQVGEAEKLFRETLEIRLEVLGEEHRDTLITMNNLALLLTNQKKLDEAETLHRRALSIKKRVLGERDTSTITSMANLALVQYLRGDVEGALASYRDVLAAFEATNGARHVRTGQAHENVGGCLAALKRWDEAERELLAAHDILEDVQGPKGVRTRAVAQRLAELYTAWGKPEEAASWRMQIAR